MQTKKLGFQCLWQLLPSGESARRDSKHRSGYGDLHFGKRSSKIGGEMLKIGQSKSILKPLGFHLSHWLNTLKGTVGLLSVYLCR